MAIRTIYLSSSKVQGRMKCIGRCRKVSKGVTRRPETSRDVPRRPATSRDARRVPEAGVVVGSCRQLSAVVGRCPETSRDVSGRSAGVGRFSSVLINKTTEVIRP